MNRRTFLHTAAGAGLASALPSGALVEPQTKRTIADEAVAFQAGTPAVMRPAASNGYFTQEALTRALGVETLKAPADIEVVAYNFPSWHPSPFMEARFGEGWTEYETLKNSRPLFPGHLFPK